ncbi:hypothetical protein QFC21_004865 [Naganishia friedmannii]|uniref:Uncharacterized protein n=1 Tax=Naganishia friedmannii TaxID=89922 RepID=A0ACC2VF05_9TREE|nr:hypothetical protein QFC21_004865 [Naganishia friedmannii]
MSTSSSAPKRRLLRSAHSLPLDKALSQNTTEANNARHGVKEDVTMSLMNIGWRVRKTPPLGHASSSFSSNSSGTRSSFTSSDTGSLRSTYSNPALSTSAIFLSSSDALSSARASVQEEQERARLERAQLALLNAIKPRRDLMCLADIVDEDTDSRKLWQTGDHSEALSVSDTSRACHTKSDNYHLYLASRSSHAEEPLEEEPYRLERGRKRHTVEEDEGEVTETDDVEDDDAGMDIDQPSSATVAGCSRPIRPIKRSAGITATSQSHSTADSSAQGTITPRNRQLGLSRSAPLSDLSLGFGEQQARERLPTSGLCIADGLEGGVAAWVGRTDF